MKIAHDEVTRVTDVQNTEVKGTNFAQGLPGTSMEGWGHCQVLLQSSASTPGSPDKCSLVGSRRLLVSPEAHIPADVEQKCGEAQSVLSNVTVTLA